MTKIRKIIPVFLLAIGIVISCSKDEESTPEPVDSPTAATLLFPENNKECNEGSVISETKTEVIFKWEEATNASSYELIITNLNLGTSRDFETVSNEFLLHIDRATAYSWYVKSKVGNSNETAESEVWKFYNAGLPKESYPPFPADVISPENGSSINEGSVTLKWEGSDVDNDIASYKVVFDTVNPPVAEIGTSSNTNVNVTVSSGQVYYWKVLTTDSVGNVSNSQIFQFKVN